MTSEQYKERRRRSGTQAQCASLLGVSRLTVSRRERGQVPITRETAIALESLPMNSDPPPPAPK